MKLYLVAVVLLLSVLGIADSVPASAKVTTKILYDREYIISESHQPLQLHYDFSAYMVRFRVKSDASDGRYEDMHISADFRQYGQTPDISFAIEATSYSRGRKIDCRLASDERVKSMIEFCAGNVILRNLTSEEHLQLQRFREEQNETKGPFQIVYNRDEMTTKSFHVEEFDLTIWPKNDKLGFSVDSKSSSGRREMYFVDRNLRDRSFTIDTLPKESEEVDCYGSHPQLEPVDCKGAITIH